MRAGAPKLGTNPGLHCAPNPACQAHHSTQEEWSITQVPDAGQPRGGREGGEQVVPIT